MAYTAFEVSDDELTQEILRRKGSLDSESLEAYGSALGKLGGAAACASLGAPAAAPLCGWLGGKVLGYVASNIPIARGSTMEDLVADTVPFIRRNWRTATDRVAAVKTYLTMRDAVIGEAAQHRHYSTGEALDQATAWADARLTAAGVPGIEAFPQWRPTLDAFRKWYETDLARCTEEASTAVSMGVAPSCEKWNAWLRGYFYPPAQPGTQTVDWYRVSQNPNAVTDADWYLGRLDFAAVGLALAAEREPKRASVVVRGQLLRLQTDDDEPRDELRAAKLRALASPRRPDAERSGAKAFGATAGAGAFGAALGAALRWGLA